MHFLEMTSVCQMVRFKIMTPFELDCIRDGKTRYFRGFYRNEGASIRFVIEDHENGHDQKTQGYIINFTVTPFDDDSMRVEIMDIHLKNYRGVGIPEALILKAKELLGKTIVSSTNSCKDGEENASESISEKAKKVWIRLVDCRRAYYDPETDRYKTI